MTDRLSWREVAALNLGASVAFAEERIERTKFGAIDIPVGTVCTIIEQGLNEIWGGIIVAPVSRDLQRELIHHQADYDGCIFLDGPNDDALSPFARDDSSDDTEEDDDEPLTGQDRIEAGWDHARETRESF